MPLDNPFGKHEDKIPLSSTIEDKIKAAEEIKPLEELIFAKEEPKEEPKKEVLVESRNAAILREYGGLPSNIPINHPYWQNNNGT